jgi:TRAP-type mannitol/chloroaromatic compound transport system substrate-binding protein
LIDRALGKLSLDKKDIDMLKFTFIVDGYHTDNDVQKLNSEQIFIRKKIDEIVREIQQLENNLGFFSNAKDDNPLVVNVKKSVHVFKNDLEVWKEKLRYIKALDY